MKKLWMFFLTAVLCLALVSCGDGREAGENPTGTPTDAPAGNSYKATIEDALALLNSADDAFSDFDATSIKDAIPTFEELLSTLGLPEAKDTYLEMVKDALGSLQGEVCDLQFAMGGEPFSPFESKDFTYIGIKDGQFVMQGTDVNDVPQFAYITYTDDTVYQILASGTGEDAVYDATQYPYKAMYDGIVTQMLPGFEPMYEGYVQRATQMIDQIFGAANDAANSITLPALTAESLAVYEGMENTFRVTDVYIDSVLAAIMPRGAGNVETAQGALLSSLDFYPYFTMNSADSISGVGIHAEIDIANVMMGTPAEKPCYVDAYVNYVDMVAKTDMSVDLPGMLTMTWKSDATAAKTTTEMSLDYGNGGLVATYKQEATTVLDANGIPTVTLQNTMKVDSDDMAAIQNAFGGVAFPEDAGSSSVPAMPIHIDATMMQKLDLTKLFAANADIFTYTIDASIEGMMEGDVDIDLTVKSGAIGEYLFEETADMSVGETDVDLEISGRFATGDQVKKFPTIPEGILEKLDEMKNASVPGMDQ